MKTILLLTPLFFLSGCFDVVSYNYWEDGDYFVTDNPGGTLKSLYIHAGNGNGHGRVDYVDAIGSNETYIIVRSFEKRKEYWILNKKKDQHFFNSNEIVEGPYSYREFKSRKRQLKISRLTFSAFF